MRGQAGFTLLETVVALVIAALALAALVSGVGGGLNATTASVRYDQAVVRAKSHLALAANGERLAAGTFQGDDGGGFHWLLRVAPVQTAEVRGSGLPGGAAASKPVILYSVAVSISWQDGAATRRVVLQTEQVGGP